MRPDVPKKLIFSFLAACSVILFCLHATIEAQEYGFDVWTTANGLPQNTVTGVVQTPDGYLWLSTFDGLARFDGVRFTIFDKGNTKGILNNRFARLFVDLEGTLWALTEDSTVTIYQDGVFRSYPFKESIDKTLPFIMADANGNAVIETGSDRYYLRDGNFVLAPEQNEAGVRQIFFGKSGAKWIFERNQITRQKNDELTHYNFELTPAALSASSQEFNPFEDNYGGLWFGPADSKLIRLIDGKISVFTTKEIPGLVIPLPNPIGEDAAGNIWFITGSGYFKQTPARLLRFKDDIFTTFDLDATISSSKNLIDREGNFWGASTTGLKRYQPKIISTLSVKDGLNGNEVYPLLQTKTGDVLVGTTAGVNRYSNGKINDLGLHYENNYPVYSKSFWESEKGELLIGDPNGFWRLLNDSFFRVKKDENFKGVTDIERDSEGSLWVATGTGLAKYKDDQEIARFTIKDGLPNDNVITIHFDRLGNLWVGTFGGLAEYKDGKFITFADTANSPKGYVRAIYEDAEGILWFGTYGDGLYRLKDGKFFNYRVESGLFNNGVFVILEDDSGNFWMSSNRGIHRVSRQELNDYADGKIPKLNAVSYNESDGMLNAECNGGNIPAGIKANDGKLWFPTMGGVAIVNPKAERINPKPPPIVIENVAIDRKPIDAELLQSTIRNPQSTIEMSTGQTQLDIEYTGLSLIKSEQIKFRYKLEGLDENWVDAGAKRAANFAYLPAGTYTFHVIAANANGVWNNEGAAIKIVVHPYFYRTRWFLALVILAVGLIAWLIYHNRVSRLRAFAETQRAFSRQLIESQEAERKRIASELHDGLGQSLIVILNRAMLGIKKGNDQERVKQELNNISESALQAIDEVTEITNNLRPQLLDRLGLTKAITSMINNLADVIEIESEVDSIDNLFNETQEISVYRIVQESLNNIIKHSMASNAVVTIKRHENNVLITIKDNGQGFDVENTKSKRGGLGLVGLKERTQLLNGEFSIESKVSVGTKIIVRIQV